jgi:CRP/FNR family transcriptional regulator, anaerobic regulatory protein
MSDVAEPLPHLNELSRPSRGARTDQSSFQGLFTDKLAIGRRKLAAAFTGLPPRSLKPAEFLTASGHKRVIFRLRAGWAYHYWDLPNGRSVILDIYIPGDVIGLDMLFRRQRQVQRVSTLTSATLDVLPAESGLLDLMTDRSIALYIFWLLDQRQIRADRRLAGNTRFDPIARLTMMILDFYVLLRRRKLITGSTYNLPLTQSQIGDYLGLSAVHVNRVLRSLREEHVVDLEKNCVRILDIKRLMVLAQHEATKPACETGETCG